AAAGASASRERTSCRGTLGTIRRRRGSRARARAETRSGSPRRARRMSGRWREVLPSSTDRSGALPRTDGCRSSRAPLAASLLHVGGRDLLLRGELLQRPVLLQRLDRGLERGPELLVGLPVVDPERVGLREEVRDRELPGVPALLVRALRVLRQHR